MTKSCTTHDHLDWDSWDTVRELGGTLRPGSLHKDYAWRDNLHKEVAVLIRPLLSLLWTTGTSFTVVDGHRLAHSLQVNSWSMLKRFLGIDHSLPSWVNVSWYFCINFKAPIFTFPPKVLTVSQPVKECIPGSALHMSWPTAAATFCTSTNLSLFWMPLLMYIWQAKLWATDREMISTSLSLDVMTMELDFSAVRLACSNMHLSASPCIVNKVSTSLEVPFVSLKLLFSHVTYMTLSSSFDLNACFCQSWARNLMKLVLLLDDHRWSLHCFTLWPGTMWPKRRSFQTLDWLVQHSLWIRPCRHEIPRLYGSFPTQHVTLTQKKLLKVHQKSFSYRELFVQGSFQQ